MKNGVASDDNSHISERINSSEVGEIDPERNQSREDAKHRGRSRIHLDVAAGGERNERAVIESAFAKAHYAAQYRDAR